MARTLRGMRKTIEIILLPDADRYRIEYAEKYLSDAKFRLWDIEVSFHEDDFDHIFYEPAKSGEKKGDFSQRRARKMMFMTFLLQDDANKEIMYQPGRGTIAIFCKDLDCVMYLRHRIGSNKLQVASFFDFGKNHSKMYENRKKSCLPVNSEQLKEIFKIDKGC